MDTSLPLLGEWVEITRLPQRIKSEPSLPLLGEWVEILYLDDTKICEVVSPFAGRVG